MSTRRSGGLWGTFQINETRFFKFDHFTAAGGGGAAVTKPTVPATVGDSLFVSLERIRSFRREPRCPGWKILALLALARFRPDVDCHGTAVTQLELPVRVATST